MSVLKISEVSKSFAGNTVAVDTFSLEVGDGELVCLLGPSGSGKSTLLRMVGGFERPTSGLITIDGEDVTHLPPEKRPTGMVFQSHALWTHMDVFKNLAFGLKLRRIPPSEIKDKVEAVLEPWDLRSCANGSMSTASMPWSTCRTRRSASPSIRCCATRA
jgi:putative spermidine/putrescine transport system ATP-binding protein